MFKTVMTRSAIIALACSLALSVHAMDDGAKRAINIPSGDLAVALELLAKQSGSDLVYRPDQVQGFKTSGVTGELSTQEAVTKLLEGTPLILSTDSTGAMLIALPALEDKADTGREAPRQKTVELEEIVVTGTHIRGVTPASPVLTVTEEDIERAGHASVAELMRSLPQNFSGGENYSVFGARGNQGFSLAFPSTVNLRGLGSDATLTLIDGHRLPVSGIGQTPDISAIPLQAIERIEVLADGASALYGSDAVGGVVNFVLKKKVDGLVTSLATGKATQGGNFEQRYNQMAGTSWSSGGVMVDYEYFTVDPVAAKDRPQLVGTNVIEPSSLLPDIERHSVFFRANQDLTANVALFAQGIYNQRTTQFQFTTQPLRAYTAQGKNEQYALFGGANVDLQGGWRGSLTTTYGADNGDFMTALRTATSTAVSPSAARNMSLSTEMEVEGPLASLPMGEIRLAVVSGYREENLRYIVANTAADRDIKYAAAELAVPLIGDETLELSLAGRVEEYSDFGSTENPKVGLVYRPVSALSLRGTWGTSFRAPALFQEYGDQYAFLMRVPDPATGTDSTILFANGANPGLQPEEATSWTAGVDFTPPALPGLTVSLTRFSTDYRDRIQFPADFADSAIWLSSPVYAAFLSADPTGTDLAAILARSRGGFFNLTGGDYDPQTVEYVLDGRYQNVARQRAQGFDLQATYDWNTARGRFSVSGNGTWLSLEQKNSEVSPVQRLSGRVFYPSKFRARLNFAWEASVWSASASINHAGSGVDNVVTPSTSIASWTTVDAQLAFHGFARTFKAGLTVENLLDRDPPGVSPITTQETYLFDSTNATALGRVVRLQLTKQW